MKELLEAASKVRQQAYCPYSEYPVGAAILDEQGAIHTGCNVENVSYPVGSCAERNAIGKMVSLGGKRIQAVAVVTRDGGTPCGMCLQALLEFSAEPVQVKVLCQAEDGKVREYLLAELLPHGFQSKEVD